MYNESQKKRFISSYTSSNKTATLITQIFNWFQPYEELWGKDLSQQETELLQPAINNMTGVRIKSTELVLIILKEYVKWCGRNGYEISDGIFNVRIDTIDKIQNQMVASPLHLKRVLNDYFKLPEEETVDVIYRVFLWMAFAGLDDKDAIQVTAEDVDLNNLIIRFKGRNYELYKECREDFEKACSLTDFYYEHREPYYTTRRNRASGNLIMRGIRSSSVDLKTIRPIINKRFSQKNKDDKQKSNRQFSYRKIYLSGIFFREYERERAGYGLDFSTVIAEDIARKEQTKKYTVTKTRTLTTIANTMQREYLADYEKWKCAFAM